MKLKIYSLIVVLLVITAGVSCTDEDKYPLPYNDRTPGAYLRMYQVTSNVFDLNDLANSAFEAIYEPVDENGGNDMASIDFFVSLRRGSDLTEEVFLKTIPASVFTAVPEPTYSEYKRANIRITAAETLAALQTITADPDGDGSDTNGNGQLGDDDCPHCVPLKGLYNFTAAGAYAAGDVINYRWEMVMTDGRRYSVANPQTSVNRDFANPLTTNGTPNVTTGQFYSSPFLYQITCRTLIPGSWVGTYTLHQEAIWSPNHSLTVHQESYPDNLADILFEDQTVTLAVPAGGLSTEREFTVNYRGNAGVTMRINLEQTRPGFSGPTGNGTTSADINEHLIQMGFAAGTNDLAAASSNLGTVFVPLRNSTVDCSSERELYWTTPTTGVFGNAQSATNPDALNFLTAKPLLPQRVIPNRGVYRIDMNGLTTGDTFSIAVDDDCDEYGRRNGYCTWTRRVYLTLTKQ
jgi:hypothetical protein